MIFSFFNYYLIISYDFLLTTYIKNIIIYGILLISKRTVKQMNKSKKRKGYLYNLKKVLKEAKEVNDLRIRISKESPLVLGTTREEMDKKLAKNPELVKKVLFAKLKK